MPGFIYLRRQLVHLHYLASRSWPNAAGNAQLNVAAHTQLLMHRLGRCRRHLTELEKPEPDSAHHKPRRPINRGFLPTSTVL